MGGISRTFKLRLSPAGMDLLIEAHCRLIRATRQLLPWGTTLHAAIVHLDSIEPVMITAGLERICAAGLCGAEVHFLGAPATLNDVATRIVARVAATSPDKPAPSLLNIYVVALETLLHAEVNALCSAYRRIAS